MRGSTTLGMMVMGFLAAAGLWASKAEFEGSYVWNADGKPNRIEATFEPAGESRWAVSFDFRFDGVPHTYRGQATGSLDAGELRGEVRNENGRRTFTFEGQVRDGVFEGTHAETTRGRSRSTGSIRLEREECR